ncbi:MAG: phosphoribosylanthranilate isomerase [Pseudomonadota bacterium]
MKICGLRAADAVDAAVEAGADYLGFIIFAKSPRAVSPQQAGALAARKSGAKSVAVLVDPSETLLGEVARHMRPDIIQLHGQESLWRCRDARAYAEHGVWKAWGVSTAADPAAAEPYAGEVDAMVFDAKPPAGADRPGGLGLVYDYAILKDHAGPYLLAGGLTPETVAEAIAASGAKAVDVASGVESSPGVKDLGKIASFITAAKGA